MFVCGFRVQWRLSKSPVLLPARNEARIVWQPSRRVDLVAGRSFGPSVSDVEVFCAAHNPRLDRNTCARFMAEVSEMVRLRPAPCPTSSIRFRFHVDREDSNHNQISALTGWAMA